MGCERLSAELCVAAHGRRRICGFAGQKTSDGNWPRFVRYLFRSLRHCHIVANALDTARALQGCGGALLLTAALAIISNTFTGDERTRAFAIWGACLGIALTSGPILGGYITNALGWRWIFFVNVPACVALIFATFAVIPESRDPRAKRLDLMGIFSFSPALLLLVWALIDGNTAGWSSPSVIGRFAGALGLFVAFWIEETRQERPMIDFSLFENRTFLGSVLPWWGMAQRRR
jgi:MFS family permease